MARRSGKDDGLIRSRPIVLLSLQHNSISKDVLFLFSRSGGAQWLSSTTKSAATEFGSENAYEVLGVFETSSVSEIKASFHKLAKQTHPDLADSKTDCDASRRFVQIVAAYEILSDREKRARYDMELSSQRKLVQKHSEYVMTFSMYKGNLSTYNKMEVVEWLKWYRLAINEVLSERRVVVGTGYFDVLERDLYSAIHAAYYGPLIESMELLPACFEAEERSVYETPEVLHLVSGRDLFGMVRIGNKVPELSYYNKMKLNCSTSGGLGICHSAKDFSTSKRSRGANDVGNQNTETRDIKNDPSDAYKDIELHICGRVVATATRSPLKNSCNGEQNEGCDHIHVFLSCNEDPAHTNEGISQDLCFGGAGAAGSRILLGTITGLGTTSEEGSCFVYNGRGFKTHMIMKHRTLLVKHLYWYELEEKVSVCECRCSRARLPPSKRLHPAVYLLALAYRTLDLEDAQRRKKSFRGLIDGRLFKILNWCRRLV